MSDDSQSIADLSRAMYRLEAKVDIALTQTQARVDEQGRLLSVNTSDVDSLGTRLRVMEAAPQVDGNAARVGRRERGGDRSSCREQKGIEETVSPRVRRIEQRLAAGPAISVPTITMEGDANGAPHPPPEAYRRSHQWCARREASDYLLGPGRDAAVARIGMMCNRRS